MTGDGNVLFFARKFHEAMTPRGITLEPNKAGLKAISKPSNKTLATFDNIEQAWAWAEGYAEGFTRGKAQGERS